MPSNATPADDVTDSPAFRPGVPAAKPRCGKGSAFVGKKGRSGPAKGNLNGVKTGAQLSRRLTVGELPGPLIAVKREGRAYRRFIEAEVIAAKGEISATDAHLIDTASAATIHCGICRWLLRHKLDTMGTGDVLACSREITKGKEARDRAIKALNIDVKPEPIDLRAYLNVNNDAASELEDK